MPRAKRGSPVFRENLWFYEWTWLVVVVVFQLILAGWINGLLSMVWNQRGHYSYSLSLPRRVVVLGSIAIADAASEMGHEIFKRASFWLASSFYQHWLFYPLPSSTASCWMWPKSLTESSSSTTIARVVTWYNSSLLLAPLQFKTFLEAKGNSIELLKKLTFTQSVGKLLQNVSF